MNNITPIKIREAKLEELDQLKEMEQAIVEYERPFAPNLKDGTIQYYDIADLIQRSDAILYVATLNGKIIGSGYALVKDSKPYKTPEKYAYLGFMFVSPEHRGKGINGLIIDELIRWTKTKKLTELQLEVYAENISAIKAYSKMHFKPDLLTMRLNLDEEK